MTLAQPMESASPEQRLLEQHAHGIYARCSRIFVALFLLQWVFGIVAATVVSPFTWNVAQRSLHPHLLAATVLGGIITSLPVYLLLTRPAAAMTRHVVAIAQMVYSALLIHLTGGRIETHFHVFGSLAFIAFYRDWRVLMTATAVVAIDHMLRGIFWPQSVFGILTASNWRWLEHAAWVIFEDIFLIMSCVQGRREMLQIAQRQAELQRTKDAIEIEVERRTEELQRSQIELKAAKEVAEAASKSKSEFLANMSHEIRTPMAAILGYADLLMEPTQDVSDRLNRIQVIRRNGQHLLTVINDILDISKIEAGCMTVERIDHEPVKLVAEAVSLMGVRAAEKNLPLKVEFSGPIPKTICTDPTRLRQIILNLLGNAIKFTEQGAVRVRVCMDTPVEHPNPRIRFEVHDTGIGMTKAQRATLFMPFTQADTSMTRRFGGTGLGLTISKRLSEMLGGEIQLESKPGQGSVFVVIVETGSLAHVTMLQNPNLQMNEILDAPKTETTGSLQDMRILLAEDGLDNQKLIKHVLGVAGAKVTIAENGRLARDAALAAVQAEQPFHVILMDMQMPEMDGYEATSQLRARGYRGIIIALTAHAMESDRAKCIHVGCDDYETKPIDRKRLIKLLAQHSPTTASAAAA